MVKIHLLKNIKMKNIVVEMINSKDDFEFFNMYYNNKRLCLQMPVMKVIDVNAMFIFCEMNDSSMYIRLMKHVQEVLNTKYENKFALFGNKVKIKMKGVNIFDHNKKIISKSLEPNEYIRCILYVPCIWKNVHDKTWDISLAAEQIMIQGQQCMFVEDIGSVSTAVSPPPPPPPPPPPTAA
jgi:hypothetical protein